VEKPHSLYPVQYPVGMVLIRDVKSRRAVHLALVKVGEFGKLECKLSDFRIREVDGSICGNGGPRGFDLRWTSTASRVNNRI
jgi:hypothetical protein